MVNFLINKTVHTNIDVSQINTTVYGVNHVEHIFNIANKIDFVDANNVSTGKGMPFSKSFNS